MELDDISRDLVQRASQLASVALNLAQQIHARREAAAGQEQHQHHAQRSEITQRLQAERDAHAVRWDTLQHHPRTPLDDATLAEHWVTAAAWEPHDSRAAGAREILEQRLTDSGVDPADLEQIRTERTFTTAADTLTAHLDTHRQAGTYDHRTAGLLLAEAAQDRTEAAQHRANADAAEERAADAGTAATGTDIDGPLAEQAHHDRTADIERNLATVSDNAAADNDASADSSGPDPAGNVYARGAPSARLAGESYPEPTAAAVARTRRPARPRKATPPRQRDHGRAR
jgi:hypothetical protein